MATSPGVTSATLSALVFYWAFQKLPDWVKEDISFRNLLKNREDVSKEELEGLCSVVEKLQNVASNIQELDTDIPQIHAALLAFVQLSGQIKVQQLKEHHSLRNGGDERASDPIRNGSSERDKDDDSDSDSSSVCTSSCTSEIFPTTFTRDSLYETAGNSVDLSSLRTDDIQYALRLATFAYYESSEVRYDRWYTDWIGLVRHDTTRHDTCALPSCCSIVSC